MNKYTNTDSVVATWDLHERECFFEGFSITICFSCMIHIISAKMSHLISVMDYLKSEVKDEHDTKVTKINPFMRNRDQDIMS